MVNGNNMSICNINTLTSFTLANQQVTFNNLAISTTELEKLDETFLKVLNNKWKTNLTQYDLLTAFIIITCIDLIAKKIELDKMTLHFSNQGYVQFTSRALKMYEDMNLTM